MNHHGPGLVVEQGVNALTILVVDDEPLARWSVAETLHESGYGVVEASDAESALRVISTPGSPADLVLLDLSLPDSNDLDLLSAMHALRPATPIILMTAHGTDELFEEASAGRVCVCPQAVRDERPVTARGTGPGRTRPLNEASLTEKFPSPEQYSPRARRIDRVRIRTTRI
jgi:CheY-like chemotaxis protein